MIMIININKNLWFLFAKFEKKLKHFFKNNPTGSTILWMYNYIINVLFLII